MTEEVGVSGRTRFNLGKSKWGKLFKEADSDSQKLSFNDDVADFLNPSTDKVNSTRPKIDIAIAQRWPEAHEVRQASQTPPTQLLSNGRPKRRKNLTVGFAKTAPEIIGEGGDEAADPPTEISRKKAMMSRSVSDRRPSALEDGVPWPGAPTPRMARVPAGKAEDFRPMPVRRAQTSHNEFSPPVQARTAPPPLRQPPPPRPGTLSRTPTGFGLQDDHSPIESDEEVPMPAARSSFEAKQVDRPPPGLFDQPASHRRPVAESGREARSSFETRRPDPPASRAADPPAPARSSFETKRPENPATRPLQQSTDYMSPPREPRRAERSTSPNRPSVETRANKNPSARFDSAMSRDRSPMRERIFDSPEVLKGPSPMYSRSNGSSSSINHFPPSPRLNHSRTDSREETSPQLLQPNASASPRSSTFMKPAPSPHLRGPSPADYFSAPRSAPQPARSPAVLLRQEESSRPSSQSSMHRPAPSPSPRPPEGNAEGNAALADFAGRVAHMKGVLCLTAEREQPPDKCTPNSWLRAGIWWYTKAKTELESLMQQRSRDPVRSSREMLTQAHVDLAKTWWILIEPLARFETPEDGRLQSPRAGDGPEAALKWSAAVLKSHLKALTVSMSHNDLMPPTQSLIQGQNTAVWLDYPRFAPDVAAVLSANASRSLTVETANQSTSALEGMPLGDTQSHFYYGRMFVQVSVNTDDAATDRVTLPCMLTMLRGKNDYQTSIVISSQSELVNVSIGPRRSDGKGLTWHEVSWKARSEGLSIRLPRGFMLTVQFQERDFRSLWNLSEYTRKVEHSLRPEADEKLVHKARLAQLQYADSSNPQAFPADKVRSCTALVFEKSVGQNSGSGMRKLHRGYRLLLLTDPVNKTLNSVSHELCRRSPLFFEFITDSAANGSTAMVIRVREEHRQCRALLVFADNSTRQELYDVLNGLTVGPDEAITGKMSVASLNVETANGESCGNALQTLQWQKLGVTNMQAEDPVSARPADTVLSPHLRIIARHTTGCVTDRLNLGPGELLLRLPCGNTPAFQMLRNPQEDMTMSIDTRHSAPGQDNSVAQLLNTIMQQTTIRTYNFASLPDLHAFQAAITGFNVRFDGSASSFSISRRRMVVPIYKKWEASNVRLQVVSQGTVVQVMAFMEDFSHADAMCLQVKSTDVFESVKGDSKGKKWAVKMVDAKFSLPRAEKGDLDEEEKFQRRFVNLEGLDYAEEHDDITVGFDTEEGTLSP